MNRFDAMPTPAGSEITRPRLLSSDIPGSDGRRPASGRQPPSDIAARGRYLWQQDGSPEGREEEYLELARLLAEYERGAS